MNPDAADTFTARPSDSPTTSGTDTNRGSGSWALPKSTVLVDAKLQPDHRPRSPAV